MFRNRPGLDHKAVHLLGDMRVLSIVRLRIEDAEGRSGRVTGNYDCVNGYVGVGLV